MHQTAAQPVLGDQLPQTSGVLAARLTLKQRKFADAWLAEPNASKAARAAGYKDAGPEGSYQLRRPAVRAYIDARIKEGAGLGLAPLRNNIIETYWSIASADIRDIVSVTQEDDMLCIRVRASAEWTDRVAQAVAEVIGQAPASTQSVRIKMHDKLEALGKLAKITGLIKKEPSGFGVHVPPGGGGPPLQAVEIVVRYVEPPYWPEPEGLASLPPPQAALQATCPA